MRPGRDGDPEQCALPRRSICMIAPCRVEPSEPASLDRVLAGAEAAFRAALTESFHGLELCDRNVLRFHYFHGLTVDQLADVLCSHRAAVIRQLSRIRERILRETRRHLASRLQLERRELDRLLDVARQRFDLAIARLLRGRPTSASR
jgi:RNA polymerase sigma-70 factor